MDELDFTNSMCGKLLEVCLHKLTFRRHIKIICNLIKLVLTSIQRRQQEMAGRQEDTDPKVIEEGSLSRLLKILGHQLTHELPGTMPSYYKNEELLKELEVCTAVNVLNYTTNQPTNQLDREACRYGNDQL